MREVDAVMLGVETCENERLCVCVRVPVVEAVALWVLVRLAVLDIVTLEVAYWLGVRLTEAV